MPKPPAGTNKNPCRPEARLRFPMADGRIVTVLVRNSVVPCDPYLKLVRAALQSIRRGDEFNAELTDRSVKDPLIKQNIQI